ncbi:SDR family oxidoreductase [Stackebrandtia nassauensis]|uniref:Short-chain dehydrogenase/reductase SDR n=1 Tax=Stackebrandtia nassauensis (strain DSM 44728 / CIP 108903 / NRRL B-16338 / NBRC 102104 / LLR-40K-21) TaxID=446470 RepID=D3QAB8_STANL|nr:SDR family oxidoreductase [Stackebrandtia nassauensis]ADD42701.1 short-chain dehydrogenase/reductase SDR [Stackebrandtia nassauensis DSM 44728]
MTQDKPLAGKVALVAGATRGSGRAFAVELARAGAIVYATGRSSDAKRSEMDRPETIEGTAAKIAEAGGTGFGVVCDHLDREQVRDLVARIESEQGRLDILVNDIWGGDHLTKWDAKLWEYDLDNGFRMMRLAIDTHIITSYYALPLLIKNPGGLVFEVTDGNTEFNAQYRDDFFYDLAKVTPMRMAFALSKELEPHGGTALALSPGWLRSEAMLDHFGVTEETWRDATKNEPHFCMSETPTYVARCLVAVASDPERHRWNGKSVASWDLAPEYGVKDADGSQPVFGPYYRDIQEPGKPADPTGYR